MGLEASVSTAIHITDLDPMLPLMKQNVELNFPASDIQTPGSQSQRPAVTPSVYSWGSPPPPSLPLPPDVVLAADCVYFEPAFPLLLDTLKDLIGEGTACWFCFKRRRRADMGFAKDLKKAFTVVEIVPRTGVDDDWTRENLHL